MEQRDSERPFRKGCHRPFPRWDVMERLEALNELKRHREKSSRVIVSICDNGIGIEPTCHEKIFNIFQRLHRQDDIPGSGIDLANVRKVTQMMNATVFIQSEPGKGSCFNLCFRQPEDRQSGMNKAR